MIRQVVGKAAVALLALVAVTAPARAQARGGTPLGAVQSWDVKPDGAHFRVALGDRQASALISAVSSKIIRIQVSPDEAKISTGAKGEGMQANEREDAVVLAVSKLLVTVDKAKFGITISTRPGAVLFDCSAGPEVGFRFDVPVPGRRRAAAVLDFATTPAERFYGLGGRFNSLDQRGKRAEMWIRDPFSATGDESYVCVPFFISTRGYGLWLDSYARAVFDFRQADAGRAQVGVAGAKLDVYVIVGPAPADVITSYTGLTGRAPLPPQWAFLPWVSAGSYDNQWEVLRVAERMRAENIPCSVIVVEDWRRGDRFYEFDADQFPDAEGMLKELRQKGFHCLLRMVPFVRPRDPAIREMADNDYFPRDSKGNVAQLRGRFGLARQFWDRTVVDFSNPEAAAWWTELHRPLLKMGVDGFKTDGGEVIPDHMIFANALTGAEMHNLYPNLYAGAMYELVRREKEGRGLIWGRSGSAGIQQFPAISAGSRQAAWKNLRATITAGLSAAMSGIPFWGHDIGGYWPMPTKELYIRWAQFGAFSPIMQLHGRDAREPWRFDDETVRIYRQYATVRANLLPYIHSIAKQASETGMPLMRPLALAYPGDEQAAAIDDEYLFGPSLLVAPIHESGAVSRQVYLPEGEWIDFWENTIYTGPARISRDAPLGTIPVFVAADAILPMELVAGRSPGDVLRAEPDLTLDLYPFGKARFGLLNRGTTTEVTVERTGTRLSVFVGNRKRRCVLRILCGEPKDVQVSGMQIPPITSRRIWRYDPRTQRLLVRPAGHQRVSITIRDAPRPVLFANIEHPRTLCSVERQMTVEADVLNLGGEVRPLMNWTDPKGDTGEVQGTTVAGTDSKWRFVAPLPGPMATGGYMRFRLVAGADQAVSPATQVRKMALTPPVNVKLTIPGSRTVGKAPVPVEVTITNNARQTASGTATLSVPASESITPAATQEYTAPALSPQTRVRFGVAFPDTLPVGEHRISAQVKWQDLDMRAATAMVTKQPTWAIIGPFDNRGGRGFQSQYAPEKTLNIGAPVRGKSDRFVTWRRYPADQIARDGMLDFKRAFPGESWALAYATAWIDSPTEREVKLHVGSDFPVVVWVNGREVLRQRQYRVARPDQDVVTARLRPARRGRNVILVKVCGRAAGEQWRLYFRMTGAAGAELADLADLGLEAFNGLRKAALRG